MLRCEMLIYQPAGRAREYAALACNVYRGCDHACSYCYAPDATFSQRADFVQPRRRANFLRDLAREASKHQSDGEQVLLSFTCDPYQALDCSAQDTRRAIEILKAQGYDVCILSKGGFRALRDLDMLGPRDGFAASMTLLSDEHSAKWEPGAALPAERMYALLAAHQAGIPTWVSLEPVLNPDSAIEIIRRCADFVDGFKVGTLNHHPLAKKIDWADFARRAVAQMEALGYRQQQDNDNMRWVSPSNRRYYIKHDLAKFL